MWEIKGRLFKCALAIGFCLVVCGQIPAQTVTGTISGTVTDSSGAIIPGATVKLTDEQTRSLRTLACNEDGRFSFAAIQPGSYTIKIEHLASRRSNRKTSC